MGFSRRKNHTGRPNKSRGRTKQKQDYNQNILNNPSSLTDKKTIEELLKNGLTVDEINCPNEHNKTPFMIAVEYGQIETALFLLHQGADLRSEAMQPQLQSFERNEYIANLIAQHIFNKIKEDWEAIVTFLQTDPLIRDMKTLSMDPEAKKLINRLYAALKESLDDLPSSSDYRQKQKEQEMIIKKLLEKLQPSSQIAQKNNNIIEFLHYLVESLRNLFLRLSLSKDQYSKVVLLNSAQRSIAKDVNVSNIPNLARIPKGG